MSDFVDDLSRVLRYNVSYTKRDFLSNLTSAEDLTPHLVYADWLDEQGDPLSQSHARKIREQVDRQAGGRRVTPSRPRNNHTEEEFVRHGLATAHPNPTVRVLAGGVTGGYHPDLLDLLFHHDPRTHGAEHDAAVLLHPEDPGHTHSAHSWVNRVNNDPDFEQAGLRAKVVRGEVFLLDATEPSRYGGPTIVGEAPVNDPERLDTLVAHARERAGIGEYAPVAAS